jgi:hypothetical protein
MSSQARNSYEQEGVEYLVQHLWLALDQERSDQVLLISIGYLWKQLDHKKKVFQE